MANLNEDHGLPEMIGSIDLRGVIIVITLLMASLIISWIMFFLASNKFEERNIEEVKVISGSILVNSDYTQSGRALTLQERF